MPAAKPPEFRRGTLRPSLARRIRVRVGAQCPCPRADDLPGSQAELVQALASCRSVLEPVPAELRQFLTAPPGLGPPEQIFYRGLTSAAALLVSPTIAPYTGTPGWGRGAACRRPVRSYAACSWWSGRAARRRRRRARG